jgi:hypothetical protein
MADDTTSRLNNVVTIEPPRQGGAGTVEETLKALLDAKVS